MKYTKGPWKVEGSEIWNQNTFIATINTTHISKTNDKANADLIATAPELLEMLAHVFDSYEIKMLSPSDNDAIVALIKKAKGE